jgi:ABC-type polar amino acid transport system ATPase subunit
MSNDNAEQRNIVRTDVLQTTCLGDIDLQVSEGESVADCGRPGEGGGVNLRAQGVG